mgnify:CR=1 FL=1|jgi:hypothetical protein
MRQILIILLITNCYSLSAQNIDSVQLKEIIKFSLENVNYEDKLLKTPIERFDSSINVKYFNFNKLSYSSILSDKNINHYTRYYTVFFDKKKKIVCIQHIDKEDKFNNYELYILRYKKVFVYLGLKFDSSEFPQKRIPVTKKYAIQGCIIADSTSNKVLIVLGGSNWLKGQYDNISTMVELYFCSNDLYPKYKILTYYGKPTAMTRITTGFLNQKTSEKFLFFKPEYVHNNLLNLSTCDLRKIFLDYNSMVILEKLKIYPTFGQHSNAPLWLGGVTSY